MSSSKSKGAGSSKAGVSSASFLDLKAELAKHEARLHESKANGKGKADPITGGIRRPEKKPTIWSKKNKGVAQRNAKDIREFEQVDKKTVETSRAILERKAAIYDKLHRGKTAGLNERQYESLLVDFDSKDVNRGRDSDDDSEDEPDNYDPRYDRDESLAVPKPLQEDDDESEVEYEDDFGRTRKVKRSEVPRDVLARQREREEAPSAEDDPYVIHNPRAYFPTYEPSAERVAAVEEAFLKDLNPAASMHFDSTKEVRQKGVGFYQFETMDEEARRKQMDEIKLMREETLKIREQKGIDNTDQEADDGTSGGIKVLTAAEKRKRDIEERRRLVEAKRRKMGGKEGTAQEVGVVPVTDTLLAKGSRASVSGGNKTTAADDFLASIEKDVMARRAGV